MAWKWNQHPDQTKKKKKPKKKVPFWSWFNKDYYFSFYKNLKDAINPETEVGKEFKKHPTHSKIRRSIWHARYIGFLLAWALAFLVFIFIYIANFSVEFKYLFAIKEAGWEQVGHKAIWHISWNGGLYLGLLIALATLAYYLFLELFLIAYYVPYFKQMRDRKTESEKQLELIQKLRKEEGSLNWENFSKMLGKGKPFNATMYPIKGKNFDPLTSLHENLGWVVKTGITNDPEEIALLQQGLINQRMWEETSDEGVIPHINNFINNKDKADENYVFYIVSCSINKLHCLSEGDTGSGKTESFAIPEGIHILRSKEKPSLLFTCKGGDEVPLTNQAKVLNVPTLHIKLNSPASSDSFNPLYLPWIYHMLMCQLKYGLSPINMTDLTPYEWENQYDIEIRKKDSKLIQSIQNIATKEELVEKLHYFTQDITVYSFVKDYQDKSISLFELIEKFKTWENSDYIITNIKKHFLFSNRLEYWTLDKKKATKNWWLLGNWIFEDLNDYYSNKDKLLGGIESEFTSSVDSVINNIVNEEKNQSTDAFWNNQTKLISKFFIYTYTEMKELGDFTNHTYTISDNYLNIPGVCEWMSYFGKDLKTFKSLAENGYENYIPTIKQYTSNFNFSDDTFSSIQGSINAITQYYNLKSPMLPIICKNYFNPFDFGLQQTLLVITTNNDESATANLLLKDIFGQISNCCNFIQTNYVDKAGKNTMPFPIRNVIDEAGSGAPIPWASLNNIATKGRSQKVLVSLYYQNFSQVQNQYKTQNRPLNTLLSNLKFTRCIKSSEQDSLNLWSDILGKGFDVSYNDKEKDNPTLRNTKQENPYFNREYILNKPDWQPLEKIANLQTINVASMPFFATAFNQKLRERANSMKVKKMIGSNVNSKNFHDLCYVNFQELLDQLNQNSEMNGYYMINTHDLETKFNQWQFKALVNDEDDARGYPKRQNTISGAFKNGINDLESTTNLVWNCFFNLNKDPNWNKNYARAKDKLKTVYDSMVVNHNDHNMELEEENN